jgi:hypothetical protein
MYENRTMKPAELLCEEMERDEGKRERVNPIKIF